MTKSLFFAVLPTTQMGLMCSSQPESKQAAFAAFLRPLIGGSCGHRSWTIRGYTYVNFGEFGYLAKLFLPNLGVFLCAGCLRNFRIQIKLYQDEFLHARPRITRISRDRFLATLNNNTPLGVDICGLIAQYGHSPVAMADAVCPLILPYDHMIGFWQAFLVGQQMVEIIQSSNNSFMIRLSNGLWLVPFLEGPQRIEWERHKEEESPPEKDRAYLQQRGFLVPLKENWMHKTIEEIHRFYTVQENMNGFKAKLAGSSELLALVGFSALF